MNARRILTSCVLLTIFCSALSATEITVGSLNLEWFGHGFKPRTGDEITMMANYIRSLEVDILACQEILPQGDTSNNGTSDWQDLLQELGQDFQVWHGDTGGSQRLAYIWRTDRVQVTDLGEMITLHRVIGACDTRRCISRADSTDSVSAAVAELTQTGSSDKGNS